VRPTQGAVGRTANAHEVFYMDLTITDTGGIKAGLSKNIFAFVTLKRYAQPAKAIVCYGLNSFKGENTIKCYCQHFALITARTVKTLLTLE
jgi:hypothetical protein